MVVKNEQQWVWYALASVLPYVDRVIVVDTGSTDDTLKLLRRFKSPKLTLLTKLANSRSDLVSIRQMMVNNTTTPWFLLVDGDEIWPENQLKSLTASLAHYQRNIQAVVVDVYNCVGDIFHRQDPKASKYRLLGKTGAYSIRAFRNSPGFSWQGQYPLEAWCDPQGESINHQDQHLAYLPVHYWHTTHLKRSDDMSSRAVIDRVGKYKLELGYPIPRDHVPSVFFNPPKGVPSAMTTLAPMEWLQAAVLTPPRYLKRRIGL